MKIAIKRAGYDSCGCLYSEIEIEGVPAWKAEKNDSESCYVFLTNEEPDDIDEFWNENRVVDEKFITLKAHASGYRSAESIVEEYLRERYVDIL